MRLLLVYPGPLFSTLDVANGYLRAFKRRDDIKLFSFHYENALMYHHYAQKIALADKFDAEQVTQSASDDLLVKILKCRPDWVLFISGIGFSATTWAYVRELKENLKNPFRMAVFLTESPYVEEWETGILQRVDVAFTTDYGIIPKYREVNPNLFYVKHAYDPEIHYGASNPRTMDVFMVGTGFPERQRLLEQVNWDGIDLNLYGNWMYMGTSELARFLKGSNLKNAEAAEMYRNTKMALNIFRTVRWPDASPEFIGPAKAKSLSPRVYEAMACGACLVTDWREELDTLPKDSYALWGDTGELEERVRWLLAHDAERERIAKRGFDAIQGETFDKRANDIVEKLHG